MKRITLGLLVSLSGLAFAQSMPPPPMFDAADVHVSAAGTAEGFGFLPNGRLEFHAATLLHLIAWAYGEPEERVDGGPSWLAEARFTIVAKAVSGTSLPRARIMLQNLLVERFSLAVQHRARNQPVHALILSKRIPLKESSVQDSPQCRATAEGNNGTYTCRNMTIGGLAGRLTGIASDYFNYPVVDRTGLNGAYDFTLQWIPRAQLTPGSGNSSPSLFYSMETQLGIKLETQTAPVQLLSVDRAERIPAANPPDVSEKLGASPTEFEAAQIRPSTQGEKQNLIITPNRLEARAMALKELISMAYEVDQESVTGGEKWLESERFDVIAKTAEPASRHTLRLLLRALLAERFRLKLHRGEQSVTVYALVPGRGRPKLTDADPAARTTCKSGAIDGGRVYTCQNTTMAQLAEKLRSVAPAYLDHPVVDLTGLKGSYDFALNWVNRGRLLGNVPTGAGDGSSAGAGTPPGGDIPVAAERPVGFTIFEAVDRQLGLKLAIQKHPMPVIVIDHVDRTPTEN